MNKIPFLIAAAATFFVAALPAQPNPQAGGAYSQSPAAGRGLITVALFDKVEIQSVADHSLRVLLDLNFRSTHKLNIASISFQNLRIDGVLLSPGVYPDNFTLDNKGIRRTVIVEAPLSVEMYRWIKEKHFGTRVQAEGAVLFNGTEPGFGTIKPLVNEPASVSGQNPTLVAAESVMTDMRKITCTTTPTACEDAPRQAKDGQGPPPPPTWKDEIKSRAQGRLVVLQATYTVDSGLTRGSVSVYRQGFRLPTGEIVGPTDLLDAAKVASAPISVGNPSATISGIEAAAREVLDFFNGKSDKPASGNTAPSAPGQDLRIVAWVPTPAGSDRINLGLGTGYQVRLKKRLATTDSGANRSELGLYDFQGDWPPMSSNDLLPVSPLQGFGECIHVRLEGVPQAPVSTPSTTQAVAGYGDLPSMRPMGVMAGMGTRSPAAYYGSVIVNRDGRFVAIVNSEDSAVTASELERAALAPGAPDPTPNRGATTDNGGNKVPVKESPATFELRIESNPAGANVFIGDQLQFADGKPVVTPATLHLAKKTYTITLTRSGYSPLTREVTLDDDLTWKPTLKR